MKTELHTVLVLLLVVEVARFVLEKGESAKAFKASDTAYFCACGADATGLDNVTPLKNANSAGEGWIEANIGNNNKAGSSIE